MWEVGCLRCGMFHMCYVWAWIVLACLLFGVWDAQDVEFLGCGMIRMCDVWFMGRRKCGKSGMRDVWDVGY